MSRFTSIPNASPTAVSAPKRPFRSRFPMRRAILSMLSTRPGRRYPTSATGRALFSGRGLIKRLAERPLPLATVYENAMSAGLKAMALAGCGVGWIPESLITEELKSGQLGGAGDAAGHLPTQIRVYRARARCRPAG